MSGTITLAAGSYGHDGWKAGAAGCTYTYAESGGLTTITITAGSLKQIVPGKTLESGTVCLSWSGTAQGKIDSGSYAASGVTGTAMAGTNLSVEFGTGTLTKVQLNYGSVPLANAIDPDELRRCLPYCKVVGSFGSNFVADTGRLVMRNCTFEIPLAGTPTAITIYSGVDLGGTKNAIDRYGFGAIDITDATFAASSRSLNDIVKTGAFVTTSFYNGSALIVYEL